MFEIATELALILILAAFVAGFVDAIAGGGGLVTVPVLLLCGANPVEALATNKLQGTFGAATAALSYARAGHVRLSAQLPMAGVAAAAGAAGALVAHLIPVEVLRVVMPVVLIAVAAFFALRRGLSDADRAERVPPAGLRRRWPRGSASRVRNRRGRAGCSGHGRRRRSWRPPGPAQYR